MHVSVRSLLRRDDNGEIDAAQPPQGEGTSRPELHELELAALRQGLPTHGLIAGDIGTVVFVHADGAAYEVEFMTADGNTLAVETLLAEQVEPVSGRYILHARKHIAV